MRVSVFGMGYVGAVSSACLASFGNSVVGVDISPEKVAMLDRGISPIVEKDIAELIARARSQEQLRVTVDAVEAVATTCLSMVSVGTPSTSDGSVSLRAVKSVIAEIGAAISRKSAPHIVVMRSTVPPGTGDERLIPLLEQTSHRKLGDGLYYYSNPEFLREGSAVRDFHYPPFTLVGAPAGDDAAPLREIYSPITAPLHVVPYRIAESVKFLSNAFHAVKLAFANEAGSVLAACGVDAPEAFRLFCEDRQLNISPAYLRPGFAFGGSCLPKDVRSFLALAGKRAISTPLLSHVLPSNNIIVERAFDAIARHGRQPVGLFGLAFKQGTDDLRESPFVTLAERLIGRGWDLRIFDRSVNFAALMGSNRRYIDQEIPHLERLLQPEPEEILKGCRLVVIGHLGRDDLSNLCAALSGHTVIDLVGVPELRMRPDLEYQGICW